tara:strand:- start:8 stop:1522 length:1515 start_codon:yes stop_codon:yes gene_type:complete
MTVVSKLTDIERIVLKNIKEDIEFKDLVTSTKLKDIEVMRALQWLKNKDLVSIDEKSAEFIFLDKNGLIYLEKDLPEIRFLQVVKSAKSSMQDVMDKAGLEKVEVSVCLGILKKKAAIEIQKDKDLNFKITSIGKKLLEKPSLEQFFLEKLSKESIKISDLKPEEKLAFDNLISRKQIIRKELIKDRFISLTSSGKKISTKDLDKGYVDKLTSSMLKSGSWKDKDFRSFDVEINVPKVNYGRRHFVKLATDYAKNVWLNMGFKEMTGTLVNTSFWNFDALFTAQDHPVRELQDTFFLESKGTLPDKKIVNNVKKAHETGTKGSIGWRYNWSEEDAKKNVLRTHTTVISAQTLSKLKETPGKYFALGRCFRNETMDWSHLFEFNQTEGIVIDPDANFKHLLGYLKQFFAQMGFPEARFRPAHFPYTEPSVEIDVFHPKHKKWIEFGGAGIFRPEVVEPIFGKFVPVLAWGPGFDRIILEYFNITDIRDLYKNDLKQLRETRYWMK